MLRWSFINSKYARYLKWSSNNKSIQKSTFWKVNDNFKTILVQILRHVKFFKIAKVRTWKVKQDTLRKAQITQR